MHIQAIKVFTKQSQKSIDSIINYHEQIRLLNEIFVVSFALVFIKIETICARMYFDILHDKINE